MAYSQLLDETMPVGSPSKDFDELLELGDFMAEGRPGLIVYIQGSLQKWETLE